MQTPAPIIGIFLIHGFLGSPREWEVLETQLQAAGYKTHAVTQLAHGKDPEHKLSEIDARLLLQHCQREYETFAQQCDQTYIIGHSMGGVSALWLAGQQPEKLTGVLAFSTPYEHAYGVNFAHGFLKFKKRHLLQALQYGPEFLTDFERPLLKPWWLLQLQKQMAELLKHLRGNLSEIVVPVWLAHAPYDIAIPYVEMEKIAARINKSQQVQMHTMDGCGHQVFVRNRKYEEPYQLVFRFLEEVEPTLPGTVYQLANG